MADVVNSIELATELTIAWLSNPNTRAAAEDVPAFLNRMHSAVDQLTAPAPEAMEAPTAQEHAPAVSARKSLASKDHIISMIDGKPYKTLRRHLSTHGLTPDQYRQRYGLKPDYPMVAATYSENRREMAKKIGLGRKPKQDGAAKTTNPVPTKRGRGRRADTPEQA
jgi:predicted transcriptional regulator